MLRAVATVVALLAALPAVTPLLGGYRAFSECRNLTHLGPGSWPDMYKKQYNYTGLLVMPGDVCSGSLVAPKYMLSSSLCRLWKITGNESFQNDVDDNESEVRIGVFQGDISQKFFQSQRVKQYLHWGSNRREVLMNPVMIVETEEEFEGPSNMILPGMLASSLTRASTNPIVVDIVGYEHSVNMPIYHQAIIDAHVYMYKDHCQKYGRKKWELSDEAFCTWDVSPVRTVCQIDRGAPVVFRNLALGITLGFVDDMTEGDLHVHEMEITGSGLPYEAELHNGFGPGSELTVTGRVYDNAGKLGFHVNLENPECHKGKEVVFHFNPRFSPDVVVRNSYLDGAWGKEEREGASPFRQGAEFNLTIICGGKEYKVHVNGKHFITYTHRRKPQFITHLALSGDMSLTKVVYKSKKHPSSANSYCGQGRIHYNVFLMLRKYGSWIKEKTGGKAKLMKLVEGRVVEEDSEDAGAPEAARPARPTNRRHFPERIPYRREDRSGAGRLEAAAPSLLPLLLAAFASVPCCVCET